MKNYPFKQKQKQNKTISKQFLFFEEKKVKTVGDEEKREWIAI